jgi:hypothetical protein
MLRHITIATLVAAGICGLAHADVYRWVDDHGIAHYSDQWVPGSELIKSSRPRPVTDSSATPSSPAAPNATQGDDQAKQQKAAQQAVKQDVAQSKEAQCKLARDRYQKAIDARRMYKPPKPGDTERTYMSDDEIDAYRLQARNDVTLTCGSAPVAAPPQTEIPTQGAPTESENPTEGKSE